MKNISIPKPCSENWESMSTNENGRFCSACSKCVIDFIEKQPKEIQQIFVERKDEEICGRFHNYQLNNNPNKSEQIKTQFFKYIPSYFQSSGITLAVFSFVLFLTGCTKQKESCTMTTGVLVVDSEVDTTKNNDYTLGAPIFRDQDSATINQIDSINSKKSKSK